MNSDIRLYPEDRVGIPQGGAPRKRAAPGGKPPRGNGPVPPGRGKRRRKKGPRKNRRGAFWLIGKLVKFGIAMAFLGGIAVAGILGYYAMKMPPPSELAIPERPANVKIVAMDGSLIGNRGKTGGEAVRLFELPRYLPEAVMAIEDRRFYSHYGIDLIGLARAMAVNLRAGGVVQGGSTLTQQLAKNLFLEHERTIERKIQELLIAFWLEWTYSKDEIMEMYLNRVYLGDGATGVEAAAQTYYGKSARQVSLAEAATIARPAQGAVALRAVEEPGTGQQAHAHGAAGDARQRLHHRERGQDRADAERRGQDRGPGARRATMSPTG